MTEVPPVAVRNGALGFRGYIASRPVNGTRLPQNLQNLIIRDYARRQGLRYLLSATEYAMPDCYMMLEQVLQELPKLDGIICYSLFMLPRNPRRRRRMLDQVLADGKELHAAAEGLAIRTEDDAWALDDLLSIEFMVPGREVFEVLRGWPNSFDQT